MPISARQFRLTTFCRLPFRHGCGERASGCWCGAVRVYRQSDRQKYQSRAARQHRKWWGKVPPSFGNFIGDNVDFIFSDGLDGP
jgi:hypothetical protein